MTRSPVQSRTSAPCYTEKVISDPFSLLKSAFRIYREKFSIIAPLGSIVLLIGVFQLLSIEMNSPALMISSVLSGVAVSYIVYVAMISAISSPLPVSLAAVLEEIQPKIVPAALVSALMVLVVSGGFLFLIVPGLAAVIFLLFSMMSAVVDGRRKQEALIHSWMLVRGRWWKIFFRFAAANIAVGFAGALAMFAFWLLGVGENPFRTFSSLGQNARAISFGQSVASQIVSNFLIVPMNVAFTFVLYRELKKFPDAAVNDKERAAAVSWIRFFTGAGVAFVVAGIFIFGFFLARFLPEVVSITHAPAAVFEAF